MLMLEHHWPYIFSSLFFLVLIVVVLPLQFNKYLELRDSLESTKLDITRLKSQKEKIDSYSGVNIDDQLKTMQTVYPDKPDRFSLFKNISLIQSGETLVIQNFSSPFSDAEDEKIGINVRTLATIDGFKNLLSNYFFRTGKLATIDNIFYDLETQDLNFTLYFHSKLIEKDEGFIVKKDDAMITQLQDIRKILATLNLNQQTATSFSEAETASEVYDVKQNPFQSQ